MKENERIKYRHLNRLNPGDCFSCGGEYYLKMYEDYVNLKTGMTVKDKRIWKGKYLRRVVIFIW